MRQQALGRGLDDLEAVSFAQTHGDQFSILHGALRWLLKSGLAYDTARNCLIDTLGCGLEALSYPACTKLLGPIVPNGARVPGTIARPRQSLTDPIETSNAIGRNGYPGRESLICLLSLI